MTLVLVTGYSGSGKSELAKMIAAELRWPLLDKDTLGRPFVEAMNTFVSGDPHDRDSEIHRVRVRPLEYEVLDATIRENLGLGIPLVVTAPYLLELSAPGWADDLTTHVEMLGSELLIIWVKCDIDSMRSRIVSRGALRDQWKLANWTTYRSQIDPAPYEEVAHIVVENSVDSLGPLKSAARDIAARLQGVNS